MDAVTHLTCRDGEHPAQLAAAKDADGRAWNYRCNVAVTATSAGARRQSDWREIDAASRAALVVNGEDCDSNSAALIAPAFAIAMVPTGIPPGI